eukprot:4553091-Ditylum_brightwellii.AAC.1
MVQLAKFKYHVDAIVTNDDNSLGKKILFPFLLHKEQEEVLVLSKNTTMIGMTIVVCGENECKRVYTKGKDKPEERIKGSNEDSNRVKVDNSERDVE